MYLRNPEIVSAYEKKVDNSVCAEKNFKENKQFFWLPLIRTGVALLEARSAHYIYCER